MPCHSPSNAAQQFPLKYGSLAEDLIANGSAAQKFSALIVSFERICVFGLFTQHFMAAGPDEVRRVDL